MMVVIIGGSGFVGTRLCRRLTDKGIDFVILDKAKSHYFPDAWIESDVRDIDSLRQSIPESSVVINLAAEHRDDVHPKSLYDDVNVGGAKNICQVAEEKSVKHIVFTSSVACYGFAAPGTDENGEINPFNDYGRTKAQAEKEFGAWQDKDGASRTLVVVRPTVIFGEGNRGNVYNLLSMISSGKFVMVGDGNNTKSMAYVENVAAFIEYSLGFSSGTHVYNYIDKPDFTMNSLVGKVRGKVLGNDGVGFRIPYFMGLSGGYFFDVISKVTGLKFPISAIRVKKFCATTSFSSSVSKASFVPPVDMESALDKVMEYEFLQDNSDKKIFYSE